MIRTSAIAALALLLSTPALAADYQYQGLWAKPGLSLQSSTPQGVELNYSLDKLGLEDVVINREPMQAVVINAFVLPNQAGAPDVPSISRWVAVPQGAKARVEVVSKETEVIKGVELAPAPVIPSEKEDGLVYFKDQAIYSTNAAYPDWIAKASEPTQLRGVDAVLVAISPLQYNPVTKELFVHRNIRVRVSFEGGNGHFGEDRLRSRWWDPILAGNLLNFDQLPKVDYDARAGSRDGSEYVIICPNDATCLAWADTIKQWRKLQGISTEVYTTAVTGTSAANIEAWINNAYNNWGTPPVGILLIGDRPGQGVYTMDARTWGPHPYSGTYYPVDNIYADVNGDSLPDVNVARMTANTPERLATMVNKFLSYERSPYTNPNFYNKPLMACGWQTERWFQLCTEVVRGFFDNIQGKSCAHAYKIYSGTPSVGGAWSTATNTSTVVNYFNALGYIPTTNPYSSSYWDNGTAAAINDSINAGAFIVQHRDHGWEYGWGEPAYTQQDAWALTNTMYPFLFTINCLTGAYQQTGSSYDSVCLGEAFHRQPHGVLGFVGPTETSYSFVNDAFTWGMYDCLWPQFDPGNSNGYLFGGYNLMPGFAHAYGKYYLQASSWPYNTESKNITYNLFHMHGDAFTTLYSEVPQDLTVSHDGVLLAGITNFSVSVEQGGFVALTMGGEIIGTGTASAGKGAVNITIPPQTPGSTMLVTVTKPNYRRYSAEVPVIAPSGPFVLYLKHSINDTLGIPDGQLNPGETVHIPVWVKNLGTDPTNGTVVCTLKTSSPYVTITEAVLDYGAIAAGDSAVSVPGFVVSISSGCPHQQSIAFDLVAHDGDTAWTSRFTATVYVSQMAPTPDNAAGSPIYYAVEDIDAAPRAPVYQWIDIRAIGTRLAGLTVSNQTQRAPLPFAFKWYGTTYEDSVSVCTNGWMAFGRTQLTSYNNTGIPASTPNVPAVFALWDDLTASVTGSWIGYWHDADNDRFIVQWDSIAFNGNPARLRFQVVLEESTAVRPYYDVLLYYSKFADPSSDISVGFQQNSTVGCQLQYDTSRAMTFSPLANGRAVRITRYPYPLGVIGNPQAQPLPSSYRLEMAYPNPVRSSTTIKFGLPKESDVRIEVYNIAGQRVKSLVNGRLGAGYHQVTWRGQNDNGQKVGAGVYLVRLVTPEFTGTRKMMVIR